MIEVREERPGDIASIRQVHDEAFGQPEEARLVDALRNDDLLSLSLVAAERSPDGAERILGHVAVSPASMESSRLDIQGLAPLAVLPKLQKRGIGSELMRAAIECGRKLGWDAIVLLGHPEYYPRFGFTRADSHGLATEFEAPPECFMVLELREGALADTHGTVRYAAPFDALK